MSERPFKDDFEFKTRISHFLTAMNCGDPLGVTSNIFKLIEADREAVRAETREEVLKDFEDVGHMNGRRLYVRRPAKKRPRTRNEKIEKLKEHFANQHAWLPEELKDGTLDDLCQAFEIPTEVDE